MQEVILLWLAAFTPFFIGFTAFALIAIAAWPRPSKPLRVLFGALGSGLLLWALWYFILGSLLN